MTARRLACLVVALLVGPAAPAHALIVTGPLTVAPGGCTRDVSLVTVPDPACAPTTPGLGGPAALAVDGSRLFVAAADDGAVTALIRHHGAGLVQRGPSPRSGDCVAASGTRCSHTVHGLAGVDALAVSADGHEVYAGSTGDRAVVALDASTLAPIGGGCVARRPGSGCAADPALGSVGALALSPHGDQLYAATFGTAAGQDTLVTLSRNPSTGALAPDRHAACVQSLGHAPAVCPTRAPGLEGLIDVVVTADGRFAYTVSPTSSAVVALRRNRSTGHLTPLSGSGACLRDATVTDAGNHGCAGSAPGLRGARGLALSGDQRTLYVIGADPGSIQALARNPSTGRLTTQPGGCLTAGVTAGCTTVAALRGAQSAVVASHGTQLVVAALGADAVVDLAIGAGGRLGVPSAAPHDLGTLSGPATVAAGADAPAVYVASALDDSVATLVPAATG